MAPNNPADLDEEEPPLDPAVERVRQKLAWLLLGSLGVMLLGLIAVFSAIVYKVGAGGGEEAPAVPAVAAEGGPIRLPPATEVLDVALDGGRALLHVREPGGTALLLVDLESGRVLLRRAIAAQ
ncbi:hypothetical protein [Propylenella binzhouense]|uniref:Fimbrial protein n=1 Tax=Propylenella binzhouense TaxID=2555902 RepID=A0A964T7K4_9HYPH|nr:hypothetical protein [Propylenella binzhouense]MYZ49899.1 hypothetical protein [Propylenella binzhouense]